MTSDVQAVIEQIRKLAARGDYATARRRIVDLLSTDGTVQGELKSELDKQGRTLEVLESIDVVRRLLRKGDAGAAAQASSTILDALTTDEYARLGVVAAALTLLGRAGELARRAETTDGENRFEVDAFVEYLGSELNQLGRDSVDRPLEQLLDPGAAASGAYTLGDLLSRRPWKAGSGPALEAVPEAHHESPSQRAAISMPMGDSPVIGRILIEQEERERVSTAPQTQTAGAGAQADAFDIVGRASLQNWWVVLMSMLAFAFIGYAAMTATPDRWQSSALLQKTQTSKLRAPITGEPTEYVPSLPSKTVLEFVKLPTFHQRVSDRLNNVGWGPGEEPKPEEMQIYPVTPEAVGQALSVTVTETSPADYLIEFRAVAGDSVEAQAIAGAAADEFREMHYEHVTREATLNLGDYEERAGRIREDLDKVYKQRMNEFATGDVEAIGVDIESRTRSLVQEIKQARNDYADAKIELRAAREALDSHIRTAERLPEYELPQQNARVAARRQFLEQLERELYELARKRNNFGEKHPIQERIKEVQEDIELVKAEIRELERGSPDDIDQRKLNPHRAHAEDLVTAARSRVTIAQDTVTYLEQHIPKLEAELEALRADYLKSEALRREELDLLRSKERTDVVIEELSTVKASADRELAMISPAGTARKLERETLVGIAIGLVLGLVVGIGIAVGLMRRRQVRGAKIA